MNAMFVQLMQNLKKANVANESEVMDVYKRMDGELANMRSSIHNLETQIANSQTLKTMNKVKFPADTEPSTQEHCKVCHAVTLRSEKSLVEKENEMKKQVAEKVATKWRVQQYQQIGRMTPTQGRGFEVMKSEPRFNPKSSLNYLTPKDFNEGMMKNTSANF